MDIGRSYNVSKAPSAGYCSGVGRRAFASFDFSVCNHTVRQQLLRLGQSLLGFPRTVLLASSLSRLALYSLVLLVYSSRSFESSLVLD